MAIPPLVSVIVPTYESAATIGATLDSALAQTHRAIEVIVVDDGSPDATAAIVAAYAQRDPRVRLIRQANRGVATARNVAIEASRGAFVAPLDGDDLWMPTKLERQLRRFASGDADLGLVYAWSALVGERGTPIGAAQTWRAEGWVLPQLVCTHFVGNASSPLVRREVLDAVGGYDASLVAADSGGCEDWDLALRVADRYAFGVVPAFLVGYRMRLHSMSSNVDSMWRSYEIVLGRVRRAHPELPAWLFAWSRGMFLRYLADLAYREDRFDDALRWLVRALGDAPALALSGDAARLAVECSLRAALRPLLPRHGSPRHAALERSHRALRRVRRSLRADDGFDLERVPRDRAIPWERRSWSLHDRVCASRWQRAEALARPGPANERGGESRGNTA